MTDTTTKARALYEARRTRIAIAGLEAVTVCTPRPSHGRVVVAAHRHASYVLCGELAASPRKNGPVPVTTRSAVATIRVIEPVLASADPEGES
ncbi:hypothetical protein [Streptomyces sp. NEAU-174]|uniref:hypothetical protein n=1 Tax=Streptomyces sp. NEAU-174 TaxID=3458254 RepID=UPI00404458A0